MSHPVLPAVACCCAGGGGGPRGDCYCGTLCVGCRDISESELCTPDPLPSVCIAADEWGAHFGDLPGTGSGALLPIDGQMYYFPGTTTVCEDPVDASAIDWDSGYRVDECPETCPHTTVRITWSGSVTYEGICCYDADLGWSEYTNAWSSTQTAKTSPDLDIAVDGACADPQGLTDLEYPSSLGSTCVDGLVDPSTGVNHRLRFRLTKDYTDCVWVIRVEASGSLAGGTYVFWSMRYTAPISVCPPTTGWTHDVSGSTYPGSYGVSPDCDVPEWASSVGVSAFSAGGVSLEFV